MSGTAASLVSERLHASGASAGGSQRTIVDVCPAGYFSYYDANTMSIDGGGGGSYKVTAGGGGIERGMGTLDVIVNGDDPYLQLTFHDGRVWEYAIEWKGSKLYMDGSRYFRTKGSAGVDDGPRC